MKDKAIMFFDYNDTFDDVAEGKGNVFIASLKRFVKHFDGQVQIAVITSASANPADEISIRTDLKYTLTFFPQEIKEKFCYLIEENCKFLTTIYAENYYPSYGETCMISQSKGTKKDGVENLLNKIDKNGEISTCVFAGNSEIADLPMIDAEVGNRKKILLLANKRILKAERYPVYKLSLSQDKSFDTGKEIKEYLQGGQNFIIKTTPKSFGVGKGIEALTNFLIEDKISAQSEKFAEGKIFLKV